MDLRRTLQAMPRIPSHTFVRTMLSRGSTIIASIGKGTRYGVYLLSKLSLRSGASIITAMMMLRFKSGILKRLANLYNGVPGPVVPKIIGYWRPLHLYRGTYQTKLVELHHKYGLIVQIGPSEYSVSDISALPYWWKLEKSNAPDAFFVRSSHHNAADSVHMVLSMLRIYDYEPMIDKCNLSLLKTLLDSANQEEGVQLTNIIHQYAFDILFVVITGKQTGIFDNTADTTTLIHAMENWKCYAMASGAVTRLFPRIAHFLRRHDIYNSFEQLMRNHLTAFSDTGLGCPVIGLPEDDAKVRDRAMEACLAIVLAGADPLITHLQSSLFRIYNDKELLEQVREEIENVKLSQPPTIKELVYGTLDMPLLHATLQESLRLHHPHTNSVRLVSPKGGVVVVDVLIPEDAIIAFEPSIVQVNKTLFGDNSETFDPHRWLTQPAIARAMSQHVISFGAGTAICPGQHLHTTIITKLLTQIIPHFDIEMAPTLTITTCTPAAKVGNAMMSVKTPKTAFFDSLEYQIASPSTPLPVIGALNYALTSPITGNPDVDSIAITSPVTPIDTDSTSFKDFQDLQWRVGEHDAKAIMARFDPRSTLTPGSMLVLKPLHDARDRFMAHDIIDRIYGTRLIHETGRRTDEMHLWVPGSKVPFWLQKLHQHRSKTPLDNSKTKIAASNTTAYTKKTFNGNNTKVSLHNKSNGHNGAPALRASRAAPTGGTMHNVWLGFAFAAPKKYVDDIDKFTEPRPKAATPDVQIKETIKPCKPAPKIIKDAQEAAPTPVAERKSALPPHLRKKAEAAAAADAA